ncbi:haloalkane dehalogenase [Alkalihalobacterium alkalinitrilicum]|uniref:haloalkane dehalogenase n=1 Tax=Alkalihalobacterium alkalinitrilicum TaxID=427920 RepID=UPI000995A3A3|nr:haloalkane dehalogenase [Alkalihalobacterium alkalinitrilicum]
MKETNISAEDKYKRKRIKVLDTEIAYIDEGEGEPIVFLHGNPTSSYLWRNVIPEVEGLGRCLAPDLVGMGESGKLPSGDYSFLEHFRYLNSWFDALKLENVTLVLHDWGTALGFHWANENRDRIKGIAYMEGIVRPVTWDEWPNSALNIFKKMRSPKGEKFILEENGFIEKILPASILRPMKDEEMDIYRSPYKEAGETRRPMLTWPREIPLEGEPAEVHNIVQNYSSWLSTCDIPKLFINAEPGMILTGPQRDFCRTWPNQTEVTVKGLHFIQEDSPNEIGDAIASFLRTI